MLTAEQRIARRDKLGSSQAAAVMGLDPFQSAADVWLHLTDKVESFAGNEATERGNLLEPVLIQWAEKQIGKAVTRDLMVEHPSGLLVANLDGAIYPGLTTYAEILNGAQPTQIVEAKSTVMGEEWGEEGTDQVPERVNVQVHHQFACVPTARVAWIPVLLPGYRSFDWRLYRVDRNHELVKIVEASGIEFMEKYVRLAIEPSDFRPSLEVFKRMRRQPNKFVPVADELVERYLAAVPRDHKE